MRVAGLDLGTNTCLCLIADIDGSDFKVIRDEVRVVRLGQGVHASRELHPEALSRAEEAFQEFSRHISEAKCDRVLAVATSAARDVKNGQRLIDLGKKYGIPIEIISGEKEAELTFTGAIESSWIGTTAVIDVGGGSTELIVGNQNGILARVSADVGSVRLTELCVTKHPIQERELSDIQARVRTALGAAKSKLDEVLKTKSSNLMIDRVVGVAGTPTTLAAVDQGHAFETEIVHGHIFTRERLEEWTSKLASMKVEDRQKLAGMEPKRADVIVAGAICVTEAMRAIGAEKLQVSVRGLRYGVAKWCATR